MPDRGADPGAGVLDVARRAEVAAVPHAAGDPDEQGWVRPAPDADALRWDALVAGALALGAMLSMVLVRVSGVYEDPAAGWLSALLLACVTLPLAARRRWPSAVLVVVAVAFIAGQALEVPENQVMSIALFCAIYTVGAWEQDRRRARVTRAVVIAAMIVWLFVALFRWATDPDVAQEAPDGAVGVLTPFVAQMLLHVLTNLLYFGGAWFFGEHAWRASRERARTAWRTHLLVLERRRAEEQAVALERLRLARELHDAVAHHVSLMGVQAAAARTVLASDPPRAADALGHVEEAARDAVRELHGILGMLRDGGGDRAGRPTGTTAGASVPGAADDALASLDLGRLPELVERARAGGLDVTFQEIGEPQRLRPLASLNLYRIAQEALTNTRKHAGEGARSDVRLRWSATDVELEVSDDGGSGRRVRGVPSGGLGLVGMRERAAADGGTFEAAPRRSGGFVVRVRLPLTPPDAAGTTQGTQDAAPGAPERRDTAAAAASTEEQA